MEKTEKGKTILEWTYTPNDYFEEPFRCNRGYYELEIDNGKARACLSAQTYGANRGVRQDMHNKLNDLFMGVQVLSHEPYELSEPTMYRKHPNGKRDFTVFVQTGNVVVSTGKVDFKVTDSEGKVVVGTKAERVREKWEFAELVAKYAAKNPIATAIVKSYQAAVNDPDNELIHLYEVRDALAREFQKEDVARRKLSITGHEWTRLGRLANVEPLKQGRHRGKSAGQLRDATKEELEEVRAIARKLIRAYFGYLDRASRPQ